MMLLQHTYCPNFALFFKYCSAKIQQNIESNCVIMFLPGGTSHLTVICDNLHMTLQCLYLMTLLYLYVCICVFVFIFVFLYLCICLCISVCICDPSHVTVICGNLQVILYCLYLMTLFVGNIEYLLPIPNNLQLSILIKLG